MSEYSEKICAHCGKEYAAATDTEKWIAWQGKEPIYTCGDCTGKLDGKDMSEWYK